MRPRLWLTALNSFLPGTRIENPQQPNNRRCQPNRIQILTVSKEYAPGRDRSEHNSKQLTIARVSPPGLKILLMWNLWRKPASALKIRHINKRFVAKERWKHQQWSEKLQRSHQQSVTCIELSDCVRVLTRISTWTNLDYPMSTWLR